MSDLATRLAVVLAAPSLTLLCIFWDAGPAPKVGLWAGWLATALILDAVAPRVAPAAHRRGSGDVLATVTACAPCLLHAVALVAAMWVVVVRPSGHGVGSVIAMAVMIGVTAGMVGISAAHELVHRRSALLRGMAQAFMYLVSYPHFPLVHLQVHHRWVGTALDPGTSRRGETLYAFVPRAFALSWRAGWQSEKERLGRSGLPTWHWRNGMLRAAAAQLLLLVLIGAIFGWLGLAVFAIQSAAAVLLTLTIDYTQHYGVVRREESPGRLEHVRAEHSWTADHASNRSIFNLGLHADHHLAPARPHPELRNAAGSLQAPLGYPGLFLLAMVPPLWFRVMNRRLAAVEASAPA